MRKKEKMKSDGKIPEVKHLYADTQRITEMSKGAKLREAQKKIMQLDAQNKELTRECITLRNEISSLRSQIGRK